MPLRVAAIDGVAVILHIVLRIDDAGCKHLEHSLAGRNGCEGPRTVHDGVGGVVVPEAGFLHDD